MNTMNECFFFTKYEFSKTKNQDLKKFIKQLFYQNHNTILKNYQRSINLKKKKKTLRSMLNTENNCIS